MEAAWPEEFEVVGELSAAFDSIPAGSSVQHTCVPPLRRLVLVLASTATAWTACSLGDRQHWQAA